MNRLSLHRQRMARYIAFVVLITSLWLSSSAVMARPNCTTAPELCVGPLFRTYWMQHGGAATFGQPIGSTTTQYLPGGAVFYTHTFERAILEYYPGKDIALRYGSTPIGQLWYDGFATQLTPLLPDEEQDFQPATGRCAVVEPNRPAVCGTFLDYYTSHGIHNDAVPHVTRAERLALFGVPLTPVMKWQVAGETRLVQVFSHARLDYIASNAADNKVVAGNVVVDLLNAQVALPKHPSAPMNYLQETGLTVFDNSILRTWQRAMPTGYWQTAHNGIHSAVSSFTYHEYFYSVRAGQHMKYVAFTVQIRNMRADTDAPVYVDASYIGIIDVEGRRFAPSAMLKYLTLPFTPTTINPGTTFVGQLLFEVPYDTAPAQVEINIANLDEVVSRFDQTIELRVAPRN